MYCGGIDEPASRHPNECCWPGGLFYCWNWEGNRRLSPAICEFLNLAVAANVGNAGCDRGIWASRQMSPLGRQLWPFWEVHRDRSLRATDPPFGEQICGFFPKAHIAIPNWIGSQTQGELVNLGISRGRSDLKVLCKQNCTAQRLDVVVPVEACTLRILVVP